MTEPIGKVYKTAMAYFDCPCWFRGIPGTYYLKDEGAPLSRLSEMSNEERHKRRVRVGFCKCGNVFIRKLKVYSPEVKRGDTLYEQEIE